MTARERPWMKFYPADWRAEPRLRNCGLMARGLWMEMLALMHESERYGYLLVNGKEPSHRQLAIQAGATIDEVEAALSELENEGVFSRDRNSTIYSRRMIRDEKKAKAQKTNGKGGGNPELRRGSVPKEQRVRPYRRSDNPAKTQRIFDRGGGKCHWCKVTLVQESDTLIPNLFHVDHVVAVCDGGTNDEENLVSACAKCNHARARKDWLNSSDSNTDPNAKTRSDPKAHMPEARVQRVEREEPNLPSDVRAILDEGGYASPPGDLSLLRRWYEAGASLDQDILPTIRRVRPTLTKAPFTLKVFDPHVREKLAADAAEIERLRSISRRYEGEQAAAAGRG